jgi:FixJ family two-component response regulator
MTTDSITVYVIDDEPTAREALVRLCRSAGLEASGFGSVDDFLAAEIPPGDACVVADIRMPGTVGTRLPALLAERHRTLPVIFITAYDTPESREQARNAGALGYFRKPVDGQALLDAISFATCQPTHTST